MRKVLLVYGFSLFEYKLLKESLLVSNAKCTIRALPRETWESFLALRLKKGGFTVKIHHAIVFNSCIERDVKGYFLTNSSKCGKLVAFVYILSLYI